MTGDRESGDRAPGDRESGDRAPGRFVNCGTVLAVLGFLVFAFFGWLLVQFLCTGTGAPGSGWMEFPG